MAEGFLRHIAGDSYEALSAGTNPSTLNPLAVQVMREVGIDISNQCAKDVDEFLTVPKQYVVTVCSKAKEKCPISFATVKYFHWDLEDPAAAEGTTEQKLLVFRKVRDQILAHIEREFTKPVGTQRTLPPERRSE